MRRLLVAAAVGSLLLAGCSKTEEASTTSTTAPATSAPGTTEKESPGTTKKKPGTTTTTKKKGSGDPTNPDSEYCQRAQGIADTFQEGDALNPIDDPEAFVDFLGQAADAAKELEDVAPDEIQADWATIAEVFDRLANVEPDKLFEEMMGLGSEIDDAGKRIDSFTEEECGFPIGTNSSSSDDSDTTDTTRADGDSKITIDGIQAFLDSSYGDEAWVEDLDTWSVSTFGGETTITVGSPSPSDAVAVCDAINVYAGGMTPDLMIEINDADGVLLAQKSGSANTCSAA